MRQYIAVLFSVLLTGISGAAASALEIVSIVPDRYTKVVRSASGKLEVTARSGANTSAKMAQYRSFTLKLKKPIDFRKQQFCFRASSRTGDHIVALYCRGYGSDLRKPDVSFYKYTTLFKGRTDPLAFRLQAGLGRGMVWEPNVTTGKSPEKVTSLRFLIGTRSENTDLSLILEDLEVKEAVTFAGMRAEDAVQEFFNRENISCSNGSYAIRAGERAWEITSPGNCRVEMNVDMPFAVDMTGKQLAFTVKTADPSLIRGFSTYLYQPSSAKPVWYHGSGGQPLLTTPDGRFRAYESSAIGALRIDYRHISREKARKVNRFMFFFNLALPEKGPVTFTVSDLRIEPQEPTGLAATDNWKPVPQYAQTPAKVKHPVGPIRDEAIARARENIKKHPWAAKQARAYFNASKFWREVETSQLPHWIPAGEAFFKCVCPNCRTATEFAWAGRSAISKDGNTLICQKCKMTFPNEKYPENHTYTVERPDGTLKTLRCYLGPDQISSGENMGPRHHITGALNYVKLRYLGGISTLALLYAVDPKVEYAQKVRAVLLRAAEVYPGYSVKFRSTAYKNPRDGHYMGGKFHSWKFTDSGLIASLMLSYTLTYNSGVYSDADKVAIENGLAREFLWLMTAYPPSADFCSNAIPAHYNAVALCAAVLGDHDAMQWVLHSLPEFLRIHYRRDGFWHESTASYANMANSPLNLLATTLHGYSDAADYRGKDRYENLDVNVLLPQLGKVLNCMAVGILPTGRLPAVNDSSERTVQSPSQLDVVALLDPTESNKQMASYVSRRYAASWSRDTMFYRAVDSDPNAPRPAVLNRSCLVPGGGWAILRRPESAEKSVTLLTYPAYCPSHFHHGTLGFILCEDGKEVISDLGYQSWWHPNHGWIMSPLAHNIVIVDGLLQMANRYVEIELFTDHTDTLAVRGAGYRTASPDVTRYARTLIDLPLPGARKYVVDFFEVRGGKRHTYVFHADGPGFSAGNIKFKADKADRIGGPALGTKYLKNVRSADVNAGSHRFEWTFDKENVTSCTLALARPGHLIVGEGPGARGHDLQYKPLHVVTMEQAGPETLFAAAMESTAPGQEAIQKVERKDAADHTTLTVRHKYGHDVITHYRNGDLTVARYQAEGKLASVWISGDRELAGVKGHPEYRGKVLSVGKDGRTLTTDLTSLPAGYDLAGKTLSFDGMGDGAYRIASAEMKGKNIIITLDPEEIPRDVTAGRTFRFRPVVEKIFLPRK